MAHRRVEHEGRALKCFDFVVFGPRGGQGAADGGRPGGLIVEIKGRQVNPAAARGWGGAHGGGAGEGVSGWGERLPPASQRAGSLQTWATREDVEHLLLWEEVMGPGYRAALVFAYWWRTDPDGRSATRSCMGWGGRWYWFCAVPVRAYAARCTQRSAKWDTVHVGREAFEAMATPLATPLAALLAGAGAGDGGGTAADAGSR